MKTIFLHTYSGENSHTKTCGHFRAATASFILPLIMVRCALLVGANVSAQSTPPEVFSVEPEENGKLVYLPVAAEDVTFNRAMTMRSYSGAAIIGE